MYFCSVRGGVEFDLILDPGDRDDSDVLQDLPGGSAPETCPLFHLRLPRPPTRQQYLSIFEPQSSLLPLWDHSEW